MTEIINNDFKEDPTFPYLPPSMRCQKIIDHAAIHFNKLESPIPLELFTNPDWIFGVFNLHIRSEINITSKHIHIFFTIDGSGSMSDMCVDGRSKMQHIHYTLENMIRIFCETPECNISVHIQSFDSKIEKHIQHIPNIKEVNFEQIIEKIKKIIPGGSTNIEIALKSAGQQITEYKETNPDHEVVHIFLTDGEITDGSRDNKLLKSYVPTDCPNIFIGYGKEHDSHLLYSLGNRKDNEYRFVDALEKAGLVYGEIIHNILYKAISDVTIKTYDCEVYDFQTNTWSDELMIGNLMSEQRKTYHLRSKNPESCYVSVLGKTIIKTKQFQVMSDDIEEQLICHSGSSFGATNLVPFMFRQRTQETLYDVRQLSEKIQRQSLFGWQTKQSFILEEDIDIKEQAKNEINETKANLNAFRLLMLNFMKDNQIEVDPIMKMLCDDIYITSKTLGTSVGNMFTCARQTSQGRQQTYACSAIDNPNPLDLKRRALKKPVLMRRTTNHLSLDIDYNIDYNIDSDIDSNIDSDIGLLSNYNLTPYSSDSVIALMRGVSGNTQIGIDIDTENLY